MPGPEAPDHATPLPPGDEEDDLEVDDSGPPPGGEPDVLEDDGGEPSAADDNEDHIPVPGATQGAATATDDCQDDNSPEGMPFEPPMTEHDRFMATEEARRVASDLQVSRRRQGKTPTRHYGFFMEQMSAKKSLRQFGQKRS